MDPPTNSQKGMATPQVRSREDRHRLASLCPRSTIAPGRLPVIQETPNGFSATPTLHGGINSLPSSLPRPLRYSHGGSGGPFRTARLGRCSATLPTITGSLSTDIELRAPFTGQLE